MKMKTEYFRAKENEKERKGKNRIEYLCDIRMVVCKRILSDA